MNRLLFFLIFLLCFWETQSQTYPNIHLQHPRLLADTSRIQWIRANYNIPGQYQQVFNRFVNYYNAYWITDPQLYLAGSDSTAWTWHWGSAYAADEATFTVFLFKTRQTAIDLQRCRFIARQVINCMDTVRFPLMTWYDEENLLRRMSDAGSFLIDWCCDAFPGTLLQDLIKSHYKMTREFMQTYILSSAGNSYVSSHNAWNNVFCNQNTLALFGESALSVAQRDTVNDWFRAVYDKWINGFFPCYGYYRDDDGGWNWGAAYAMWSLVDQFALFENMRIGTDKNFYYDLPWVQNSINQYWYFIQPDNKSIHLGDGQATLWGDRVVFLHERMFNDKRSQWLAEYLAQPAFATWTYPVFTAVLYKDFTMPPATFPDIQKDWWADKVGLSVSRTAWDSSSTMVTFFNSLSKRAAHEHRDNNSFTIFKDKPLLIDAGYYDIYGGSHFNNYYTRTIAHNSICVYDSTDHYYLTGNPVSNDGGQIESIALMNYTDIFLAQNQRGRWKKFTYGENYSYNSADAQLSYDPQKLDLFRRRLLFIKPDKLICLDHLHLVNIGLHQRDVQWIAHFVHPPAISGNLIHATVPGHIETFNGTDYTTANGNGNLVIRTLLPALSSCTRIGGEGYEYWVDGTNYSPDVQPDTSYYAPGSWRIEIRPGTVTDSVRFLHTIRIGDTANPGTAGGKAITTISSITVDWNDTLYFFPAKGDTLNSYYEAYPVPGGRHAGIFAVDLEPGYYDVRIDNVNAEAALADADGILRAEVDLPLSNSRIEITRTTSGGPGSNIFSDDLLTIFPNPSGTLLNIRVELNSVSGPVEIFDIQGRKVITSGHLTGIDISGLPTGRYTVKLRFNEKSISGSFIKK